MLVLAWTLFILSAVALLHTYLFYPLIIKFWSRNKVNNQLRFKKNDPNLPRVTVISSLYNEEAVIQEKLDCLNNLDYPTKRLSFYIGSDCSSDATNNIVSAFAEDKDHFHFFPFQQRRGKPPVINELIEKAIENYGKGPQHILLLTDANVILRKDCLFHLVKHFKNKAIALVDAHMSHTGMQAQGISKAEDQYISGEVRLKHNEGKLDGLMIGPFGGCYALRSDYFNPVPDRYLVDDFYIAMKAFEQGGKAINDLEAVCYEAVSHDIKEEYRRKRRISAGNFQNMISFSKLWWPPFQLLSFAFFSHKILRWLGPFFLFFIIGSSLIISLNRNLISFLLFSIIIGIFFLVPLLDFLLSKLNIHFLAFRGIRYFFLMNIALFEGFFKYIKGIKTNVWQPTKRN